MSAEPGSPRAVSEAYWSAECARNVDAVMGCYHPDGTYEDSGGLRRGHAEIRAAYEESARLYPGLTVDIVREFPLGTRSALEFDAWLTDRAGRRFRIRGVNVVEVRDGRFVSVRSYEDPPMAE